MASLPLIGAMTTENSTRLVSTLKIDTSASLVQFSRPKISLGEWSVPVTWNASPGLAIDPNPSWDDDVTVYLTSAGIIERAFNINTGAVSNATSIWIGTSAVFPRELYIYKKDGWYCFLIAGTEIQLGHRVSIARLRNISGPYETTGVRNPLLTYSNTT
ncbi:hypothetical protein LTR86_009982 [Recurvomyces mirabilis]|nr:hypothetical protein LTR86_009982 [Recurvomyces mirabilis]